MPNEKNRESETTSSGGDETRFFESRWTHTVAAKDTKTFHTTANSTSVSSGSQSFGAATVRTGSDKVSLVVNVAPSKEKQLVSEANRVLSGESPGGSSDPETR